MNFYSTIFFLCPLLSCLSHRVCVATGNSQIIREERNETMVSPGKMFELGFFSPGENDSKIRYVGIWYHVDRQTVVWVANRDNPLNGPKGFITISDGNLMVVDETGTSYFTTGLDKSQSSFRQFWLLDNGNLVLIDNGSRLWQSFMHPTDTFLPGMKMDEAVILTSWKSQQDPASGDFTFRQDTEGQNHYTIYKQSSTVYWKSGNVLAGGDSFNPRQMFDDAAILLSNFDRGVSMQLKSNMPGEPMGTPKNNNNRYSRVSPIYSSLNDSRRSMNHSRLFMKYTGEIQYWNWDMKNKRWALSWSEPEDDCSIFKACGNFGMCSLTNDIRICNCLEGFEPVLPDKWWSGDYASGCKPSYEICHNDTFLNLTMVQVGESNLPFVELDSRQCKEKCLNECECRAYSYNPGNNVLIKTGRLGGKAGCWIWKSELVNLQQGYADNGHNISVKIAALPNGLGDNSQQIQGSSRKERRNSLKPIVIFIITVLVILILCSISYIVYTRLTTNRQARHESYLIEPRKFREDNEDIDVPFFEFKSLMAATENFSEANKLGQGGFGPVYKGKLHEGVEIAVKRLSCNSGQGLEEFRNEVILIAKLQHRNLVRLLGYGMKGDEKMLVYEYMPNRSLDHFIFDRSLSRVLNWTKRMDIILGISRGLLYLHHDSRLRIIHRDLKTSNILLDEDMNPKISDFGLARIVGGKETEASTNRVVGTYGYMSPEYAMEGTFSVKSDVFSFGVVMLEIISGKRNSAMYQSQQTMNRLLGHAWSLWEEGKALGLMDEALDESCNQSEFLKCLIVGLLCVQEEPSDRPTMESVVFMLGGDIASLPNPKQPAFGARKRFTSSLSSSSSKQETQTSNERTISISMEEGR